MPTVVERERKFTREETCCNKAITWLTVTCNKLGYLARQDEDQTQLSVCVGQLHGSGPQLWLVAGVVGPGPGQGLHRDQSPASLQVDELQGGVSASNVELFLNKARYKVSF